MRESMAVSLEGFSIREYAVKMRSSDVRKSWPFGDAETDPQRTEIENLLPPMICRKHVWWSEELEAVKLKQSQDGAKEKMDTLEREYLGLEKKLEERRIDETEGRVVVGNLGQDDEETVLKVCPVCQNFSATTINAMNAHIDSCLAKPSKEEKRQMRLARGKSKTPKKKRSILEIFAVSPQVETVHLLEDIQGDGFESESEEQKSHHHPDVNLKLIKKRKNYNKLMMTKKKKKKKKKMDVLRRKQITLKKTLSKEKFQKLRMPSGLNISQLIKGSSHRKGQERKSTGTAGRQKKMSSKSKNQCQKIRNKVNHASKLINLGKDHVVIKGSTRKKSTEFIPSQKLPTKSILKGANLPRMPQVNRHVKFSGNDDIIGPSQKCFSALELPQLQNLHEVFPNIVDQPAVEGGRVLPVVDEGPGRNSDVDIVKESIGDPSVFRPLSEKNNSGGIYGYVTPLSFGDSVDLNQTFQSHDSLQLFNPSSSTLSLNFSCSSNSKLPHPVHGESNEVSNVENVSERSAIWRSTVSTRKQIDCVGSSPSNSTSAISLESQARNAISQASLSSLVRYMDTNDKQPYSCYADKQPYSCYAVKQASDSCSLPYSPWFHVAPKDVMSGVYSPLDVKKNLVYRSMRNGESRLGSTAVSLFRDKPFDEGFIGLPLNSQGELIQLHSNNKIRFNQLFRKQSTTNGSAGYLSGTNQRESVSIMALSDMWEKLDGRDQVAGQKPQLKYAVPAHSDLGMTHLQSFGRPESMYRELNLMDLSMQGIIENSKQHGKHNVGENVQERGNTDASAQPSHHPTVRLMGQNVTLGRNNSEGLLLDGKTWTSRDVITEHFTPAASFSHNFMPGQHTPSVSSISNANGCSYGDVQKTPNPPMFFHMRTVRPNFSHTLVNYVPHHMAGNRLQQTNENVCLELQHLVPRKLSENQISGTNTVRMSHENLTPMTYSQNRPQSTVNEFLFPNHSSLDYEKVGPRCCSPSLPQWLQAAKQQKEVPHTSPFQSLHSITKQNQVLPAGAKFPSLPGPYAASSLSYHPNASSTSLSSSQTSCIMNDLSSVAVPGLNHIFGSGFMIDREAGQIADSNVVDRTKVTKKRPASMTNDSRQSSKRPNLGVQEVSESAAEMNRKKDLRCEQYDAVAYGGEIVDLGIYKSESIREGIGNSSGAESSLVDRISRLGPIKLSAGAKHILKPSQNIDEDNSRPIHATIPFAGITGSGKLPSFRKKAAHIYRF
ncbi:hypothetical protein H6P81_014268 [Aristolochia fimbriata]|uniref:UBZ4-type domain-containing protein n=1 Tax=Aristolochia fimbriata TaxID=158543 RepID=A0AAV7EH15_ARIFI|nr:hypothetical protein H6P81_014268 [Aristolochia fimbriata]